MKKYFILISLLCFQLAFAQSSKDKKALELFKSGEAAFQDKNYTEAITAFTQTLNLGNTSFSSAATYMTGLSYFYQKKSEKALAYFQDLITQFPKSKFIAEAKYHKAILMLENPDAREGALFLLMGLAEDENNSEYLRKDADKTIKNFLFGSSIYFLKSYYEKVRTNYKPWVAEALCYQYYQESKTTEITEFLKVYERTVGKPTEGMLKCKKSDSNTSVSGNNPNELRIALILPFQASNYESSEADLSVPTRMAMEFLNGLKFATEREKLTGPEKIIIQVFDSQKDSILTERLLQNQVKPFKPDVIIGDIFISPSAAISRFAQNNQILHIIPLAPADKLTERSAYSYMFQPGQISQSISMGKVAFDQLKFKKVYVISDADPTAILASEKFIEYGNKKKAVLTQKTLESGQSYKLLPQFAKEIIENEYDAVYLNSSKQDHYEILLNNMITGDTTKLCLLAHGETQNFTKIAPERFFYYNTVMPIHYNFTNDSTSYVELYDAFYNKFQTQPSVYACQGYDVIQVLLKAIRENPDKPLTEAMEKMTPYKGLLQNVFYGKSKTNTSVQFQKCYKKKIEWIDLWD